MKEPDSFGAYLKLPYKEKMALMKKEKKIAEWCLVNGRDCFVFKKAKENQCRCCKNYIREAKG